MCTHCGCSGDHHHDHHHAHDHEHAHEHDETRTIALEREILAKNDRVAERNRGWLAARKVLALNLVSSPGAGKTTLLERTVRALGGGGNVYVVEGDQATQLDADRVRAAGARAVQINTDKGCHLDAAMIARALEELDPAPGSVVFIENVGNLVCPALFDLGEHAKVVIASVTEGEDKPLKYPHMFRASRLLLVSKIDLVPHVDVAIDRLVGNARRVNRAIEVLETSARTGDGVEAFSRWIRLQQAGARA